MEAPDLESGRENKNSALSGEENVKKDKGDDVLEGGWGNDIYEWSPGDGNDTIKNKDVDPWGNEYKSVLRFGPGVLPEDLSLRSVEDDLVATVRSTGETITVKRWYAGESNRLYAFEFASWNSRASWKPC